MELNTRGSVKFIKNLRKSTQVNRITLEFKTQMFLIFFIYLRYEII